MSRYRKPRGNPFLFICFLVVAAILGALMLGKYQSRHDIPAPSASPPPGASVPVTLYFSSAEGDALVPEARRIDQCPNIEECIAAVVEELVNGPLGELGPTLPPTSVLRQVRVEGDTAVLDFGPEFRDDLPAGSSAEMMAVYSIVDTVARNYQIVRKVRFLIEGEPVGALRGHLDLREPVSPDFSITRQ